MVSLNGWTVLQSGWESFFFIYTVLTVEAEGTTAKRAAKDVTKLATNKSVRASKFLRQFILLQVCPSVQTQDAHQDHHHWADACCQSWVYRALGKCWQPAQAWVLEA